MTGWLTVIGTTPAGWPALAPAAQAALRQASVVFGGHRHLAMLPPDIAADRRPWQRPLADSLAAIAALRGRAVAVLASGDPMCHGIGATLSRSYGMSDMRVLPAAGSLTLACAALLWPGDGVTLVSLHGHPPERLRRYLFPARRLVLLTADRDSPARIAALLCEAGYGASVMHLLERLGAADARHRQGVAAHWAPAGAIDDLNCVAVECQAEPGAAIDSLAPGLPDRRFDSDGLLTKRMVRAAALAALAPRPGDCLWDLGAGSGSVAIEWLRLPGGQSAWAVERDPARCGVIRANAARLGVPELHIRQGPIGATLSDLPAPDAVFIGGGLDATLVDRCLAALRPGGRLVAHAVTLESEGLLLRAHALHGGGLTRIGLDHAGFVGRHGAWRPALPVVQWRLIKPPRPDQSAR